MGFFNWLFNRKQKVVNKPFSPDQVISDDPVTREVVSRALNSGKMVTGNVDKNGEVTYCQFDPKVGCS